MDKSISDLRADFPILDQRVNDEPLVYLDNAATAQRPTPVIKQGLDFTKPLTPTCTAGSTP